MKEKTIVNDYTDIAYSFMAPILTKYVMWIDRVAREQSVDGILFSARDGWILKRMYDELTKRRKEQLETIYFYTSRKVAMISGMESNEHLEFLASLPYEGCPENILQEMFHLDKGLITRPYSSEISPRDYYLSYSEEIFQERDKQRENYIKYMQQIGLSSDKTYLFVDFVASGTIMNFLVHDAYFKMIPVYACCYGHNEWADVPQSFPMYRVEKLGRSDNGTYFTEGYTFFETIMTSMEPSVAAVTSDGRPEFAPECRDEEELKYVTAMQDSVYEYFCDYIDKYNPDEEITFEVVDKLYGLMYQIKMDCPYIRELNIHQDLGFAEVKALKEPIQISVIITTYNRKYEVRRAIERAQQQTIMPLEIIVIDDNSTDGTQALLEQMDLSQVRYVYMSEHVGPSEARNEGVKLAQGNYIAFLDSDDEWKTDRLEKSLRCLKELQDNNQEVDILCCRYKQHFELDCSIEPQCSANEGYYWVDKHDLLKQVYFVASAAIISKDFYVRQGGFSRDYTAFADRDFINRCISEGNPHVCMLVDDLVECWQVHDGISEDTDIMAQEQKKIMEAYRSLYSAEIEREYKIKENELRQQLGVEIDRLNNVVYRKSSFYELMTRWMQMQLSGVSVADKLQMQGIESIAMYGCGRHGEMLYKDLLSSKKVRLEYCIDNKLSSTQFHGLKVYAASDIIPKVEAIVITPYLEYEGIVANLDIPEGTQLIALDSLIS
ncbi:MAG: glycosyltransferase [Pseudobutyrivibrio sp.]|nr:glycosyltransferase [Pseudobutyrivibrio sp.]